MPPAKFARPAAARAVILSAVFLCFAGCGGSSDPAAGRPGVLVNDVHSKLNPVRVAEQVRPESVAAIQDVVQRAKASGLAISIAGARHAMGGQQFGEGTILVDMTGMTKVEAFDPARGTITVEAGITWPDLLAAIKERQADVTRPWGIRQKQTGADRLTIGGALSANAHGRGLTMKPMVDDVESFTLVDAEGALRRCSRTENPELFRAVIGGYGLFGIIATVELRLAPRRKVERVVEVIDLKDLPGAFERRIADGYLFGDFQYAIDPKADNFLRRGVFSCYRPVPDNTPLTAGPRELSTADWSELYYLAHAEPSAAFERYSAWYLGTSGQIDWSDTHQMGVYLENYHADLDKRLGAADPATEMITEIYVPRADLVAFMEDVRAFMQAEGFGPVYGTIRLIEKDDETFLAWARDRFACVIFNLHVVHTPAGIEQAAGRFRTLIDLGRRRGGSFFPTYHRWATKEQVEACYPQFREFLLLKQKHDPEERFQSEWYRHYRAMFLP